MARTFAATSSAFCLAPTPRLAIARLRALVVRCSIWELDADSVRSRTAGMGTGIVATSLSNRAMSEVASLTRTCTALLMRGVRCAIGGRTDAL